MEQLYAETELLEMNLLIIEIKNASLGAGWAPEVSIAYWLPILRVPSHCCSMLKGTKHRCRGERGLNKTLQYCHAQTSNK